VVADAAATAAIVVVAVATAVIAVAAAAMAAAVVVAIANHAGSFLHANSYSHKAIRRANGPRCFAQANSLVQPMLYGTCRKS